MCYLKIVWPPVKPCKVSSFLLKSWFHESSANWISGDAVDATTIYLLFVNFRIHSWGLWTNTYGSSALTQKPLILCICGPKETHFQYISQSSILLGSAACKCSPGRHFQDFPLLMGIWQQFRFAVWNLNFSCLMQTCETRRWFQPTFTNK